jgi:DNA-binding NarL/FixJ family response regulator
VELLGRYSNITKPLLSGQPGFGSRPPNRSKLAETPAPRIHAIHRRLSSKRLQQLLADYQAGISANQLALRYELSRASIRGLLRESGVPRRYQAMTEAEIQQVVQLYQSGLTISQVAAKLDRPCSTVQTALTRCGVVRRSRHDYR